MTGESFINECWRCREIRQHIVNQAKRHSKNKEDQEDSMQEAWLIIGTFPHCPGIGECKEFVYKAIYSSYWQQNKERLIKETQDKPPKMIDPGKHKGFSEDGCYQTKEIPLIE